MPSRTYPDTCARCGKRATGRATGPSGARLCHGDHDATPTCYMQDSYERSGVMPRLLPL